MKSDDERRERELFAAAAIQGILANPASALVVQPSNTATPDELDKLAERAWEIATAMVRKQPK